MIELLITSLTESGAAIGHIPSTRKDGLKTGDFAACMSDLTQLETELIFAKYMLDNASFEKGLKLFPAHLHRSKIYKCWVLNCDHDDVNTERFFTTVNERSRHSPILMSLAWEQAMSVNLCRACGSKGEVKMLGKSVQCKACSAKGFLGTAMSVDLKSIRLTCSRSQYFSKWHRPFVRYYLQPLFAIETAAISKMANALSNRSN